MRLRAEIKSAGKTAAGIVVPDEFVEALGGTRRPAVRVTVAGYTYRSTIARMSGVFMLGVSNDTRAHTGLQPGQTVDFEIELDTEDREVVVPEDLAAALEANPSAREAFERLSYSNKRRLVMPIEAIKSLEARERRVARTVTELSQGPS